MGYQVRKGWPSDGAIDEQVTAATGQTVTDGMFVTIAAGKASVGSYAAAEAAADPLYGFVIGKEDLKGYFVALMSPAIIELDSACYAAGTYTANQALTIKDGKLAPTTEVKEKVVAKVISFDATSGTMLVMFNASH